MDETIRLQTTADRRAAPRRHCGGRRAGVRRSLQAPAQRRLSVCVCDGQVAQLRARRDARGVLERARERAPLRQPQRLGACVAVRLRSLCHARSAAPRAALDRRHAGREHDARQRRKPARGPARRATACGDREAARRVPRSARAVRAARADVCRDGGCPRLPRRHRPLAACIAAARCSRPCSTRDEQAAPDAEPSMAASLQTREVCS